MKLEVGMYVRDIFGKIGKLTDYNYEEEDAKNQLEYRERAFYKSSITKASFNLIDLIEVGDYVNGERVMVSYHGLYVGFDGMEDPIMLEDIKIYEVLTHEQYEANKYIVEKVSDENE